MSDLLGKIITGLKKADKFDKKKEIVNPSDKQLKELSLDDDVKEGRIRREDIFIKSDDKKIFWLKGEAMPTKSPEEPKEKLSKIMKPLLGKYLKEYEAYKNNLPITIAPPVITDLGLKKPSDLSLSLNPGSKVLDALSQTDGNPDNHIDLAFIETNKDKKDFKYSLAEAFNFKKLITKEINTITRLDEKITKNNNEYFEKYLEGYYKKNPNAGPPGVIGYNPELERANRPFKLEKKLSQLRIKIYKDLKKQLDLPDLIDIKMPLQVLSGLKSQRLSDAVQIVSHETYQSTFIHLNKEEISEANSELQKLIKTEGYAAMDIEGARVKIKTYNEKAKGKLAKTLVSIRLQGTFYEKAEDFKKKTNGERGQSRAYIIGAFGKDGSMINPKGLEIYNSSAMNKLINNALKKIEAARKNPKKK